MHLSYKLLRALHLSNTRQIRARNTRAQRILCGENGKKEKKKACTKETFSRYDRFYPLQSHDRECISSSAVKRRDSRKASHAARTINLCPANQPWPATVHHRRSNDYGFAPTPPTHRRKRKDGGIGKCERFRERSTRGFFIGGKMSVRPPPIRTFPTSLCMY